MGAMLQNVDIQYFASEQQTTSKAQKEWNYLTLITRSKSESIKWVNC